MVKYIKVWDNDSRSYRTYEMRSNSMRVVDEDYVRPRTCVVPKVLYSWPTKRTCIEYDYLCTDHIVETKEYDRDIYYNEDFGYYINEKNFKRKASHRISW